jgi:serine/threonine protein kinase
MEFCDHGDLLKAIEEHKKKGTYFQEAEVWRILIQMAKGLKALHDLKIVHRDIKSANVFLSKNLEAKLGDFNVSKIAKRGLLNTQTGTPYYASPEVWKDRPYDSKSDVWSMGVVMYELCALHPPFMANSMELLYKKVIQGVFPNIPNRYSNDLNSIIKSCLQLRPENRPTCEKILSLEQVSKKFTDTLKKIGSSNNLISTIKFDRNIKVLQKRLPKPSYIAYNAPNPVKLADRSKSEGVCGNKSFHKPLYEIKEVPEKIIKPIIKQNPPYLPMIKQKLNGSDGADKENRVHNHEVRPAQCYDNNGYKGNQNYNYNGLPNHYNLYQARNYRAPSNQRLYGRII